MTYKKNIENGTTIKYHLQSLLKTVKQINIF